MKRENEKAPAAAATTTEARENALQDSNTAPAHDNITSGTDPQGEKRDFLIYPLLPAGADNAVSRRHLSAVVGLSDRMLRRQIAHERHSGALILSSTGRGGYYRPGDADELRRFVASMSHRASETFTALSAARRALEEMDEMSGQDRMGGF